MTEPTEAEAVPPCQACAADDHGACSWAETWRLGYVTYHACPCALADHRSSG